MGMEAANHIAMYVPMQKSCMFFTLPQNLKCYNIYIKKKKTLKKENISFDCKPIHYGSYNFKKMGKSNKKRKKQKYW